MIDKILSLETAKQNLIPVDDYFSLSRSGQFDHMCDVSTGAGLLVLEKSTPYPAQDQNYQVAGELLLQEFKTTENTRILELPDNYVTMTEVLNDTIGGAPTNETRELAKQLFERIGTELAALARIDRVLPEDVHYRQIILTRDENVLGVKLMPPLHFMSVDDGVYTQQDLQMLLSYQLLNSCFWGASNTSQRNTLPFAFKGFVEAFRWS